MTDTPQGSQKRFGPILLSPGVAPKQIAIFLMILLTLIFSTMFAALMQPLLVTHYLNTPTDRQGSIIGALSMTQQAGFLLFLGLTGLLADRFGRRKVMLMALTGFILCMWVYPLASVLWGLFLLRFAWGAASTGYTVGVVAKLMDYPDNASRGKFLSFMLVAQLAASAVVTALISSRLLSWLKDAGLSDQAAVRYGFWLMSLIAMLGFIVTYVCLAKDAPPPRVAPARPARPGIIVSLRRSLAGFGQVWAHAKVNPRFAAAMLIGSVIRTDSVVFHAFLGLWIIQAGQAQGINPIEATKSIGLLFAISTVASFVTPPFFGWLADRVDRLVLLTTSLAMTALAFCAFGFVPDVFSVWMILVVVMVGLAEGAQVISSNALLGEECPEEIRGAAVGVYTSFGTASVLLISLAAGLMFDHFSPRAPFVMEGLLNLFVFALAIGLVRAQARRRGLAASALAATRD